MSLLDRPALRVSLWIIGLLGGGLLLAAAISTLAPSTPGVTPAVANAAPAPPRPPNATTGAPPYPAPVPTRSGPPPVTPKTAKDPHGKKRHKTGKKKAPASTAALRQAGLNADRRSQAAARTLAGAQKKTSDARAQVAAAEHTVAQVRSEVSGSTRLAASNDVTRTNANKTLRAQQSTAEHRLTQAQQTLKSRTDTERRARSSLQDCQNTARRAWTPVLAKLAAASKHNQTASDSAAKKAHDRAGAASVKADQAHRALAATKTTAEHQRAERTFEQAQKRAQKAITNARTADEKAQRATQAAQRSAADLRSGHVSAAATNPTTRTAQSKTARSTNAASRTGNLDKTRGRDHDRRSAGGQSATRGDHRAGSEHELTGDHSSQKRPARTSLAGQVSRVRSTLHAFDQRARAAGKSDRHAGPGGEHGTARTAGDRHGQNHSAGNHTAHHGGNTHHSSAA